MDKSLFVDVYVEGLGGEAVAEVENDWFKSVTPFSLYE